MYKASLPIGFSIMLLLVYCNANTPDKSTTEKVAMVNKVSHSNHLEAGLSLPTGFGFAGKDFIEDLGDANFLYILDSIKGRV